MTRRHSTTKKKNNRITVILIAGIVIAAALLILTEIQSTYLRTTVIPIQQQAATTPAPAETTVQHRGDIFTFNHPSNWNVTVKDNETSIGSITLYSDLRDLPALRQRALNTTEIILWDCQIGSHEALCSSPVIEHRGVRAPLGDRFVVFQSGTQAALIPAPPRSQAEQNILNSLEF